MRNEKITPLYERLSRNNDLQGESNSIRNQKQMLEDCAKRNGFPNPAHFTDWQARPHEGIMFARIVYILQQIFDEFAACDCRHCIWNHCCSRSKFICKYN